jgi:tight adherence protein B
MSPLLLLIGITLTGAIGLVLVYAHATLLAPRQIARGRIVAGRTRNEQSEALRDDLESRIPLLRLLPFDKASREKTQLELERSGVDLRVNEYLAIRLGLASAGPIAGGLAYSLASLTNPLVLVALTLGPAILGWTLPRAFLAFVRRRRAQLIEYQLQAGLLSLAKSLRTGTGLMTALAYAADESPAPLGPELRTTMRELELGRDASDAFTALARRVDIPDLDIAVTAILIQRQVGGNLSEILTNVSETVRERFELRREIRVVTARQKLSANLTSLLPVLVGGAFILITPGLGDLLINSTAGRIALTIGLGFEVVGIALAHKFAQVEV